MAVSSTPAGGYEVTFVDPIDKDLECPICLSALKEPLQTSCGHLMCRVCVDLITENEQFKCPLDNQISRRTEAFPDRIHERKILGLQVRCQNQQDGCTWIGELRHLQGHLESGDCAFGFVDCHFSGLGCTGKMNPRELKKHMESHSEYHSLLLVHKVELLERDNDDLKAHLRGKASNSCRFVWKLTGWSEKVNEARAGRVNRIYSESFYSGCPGYKMCLAVFPIGWGEDKGEHIGLSLNIKKGSYDDCLRWPFEMKYRIAIIEQKPNGRIESKTINAGSAELQQAPGFQRPTEDTNEFGYGFSRFMSLTDLKSRSFVKEDSIFFQVDVYQ